MHIVSVAMMRYFFGEWHVLATQCHDGGLWYILGGKIEPNEHEENAGRREVSGNVMGGAFSYS